MANEIGFTLLHARNNFRLIPAYSGRQSANIHMASPQTEIHEISQASIHLVSVLPNYLNVLYYVKR